MPVSPRHASVASTAPSAQSFEQRIICLCLLVFCFLRGPPTRSAPVGRLRLLIEAESLLNDGTAVAFVTVLSVLAGGQETALSITGALLVTIAGGVLIGGVVALGFMLLAGRTADYLVEITLTMLAAYGSFFVAEHYQCSGVLAALTADLVVGNYRPSGAISEAGRDALETFWEYVTFIANSLIFILIGAQEAEQHFRHLGWPVLLVHKSVRKLDSAKVAAVVEWREFAATIGRRGRWQQWNGWAGRASRRCFWGFWSRQCSRGCCPLSGMVTWQRSSCMSTHRIGGIRLCVLEILQGRGRGLCVFGLVDIFELPADRFAVSIPARTVGLGHSHVTHAMTEVVIMISQD
jgi:hypothetical protein